MCPTGDTQYIGLVSVNYLNLSIIEFDSRFLLLLVTSKIHGTATKLIYEAEEQMLDEDRLR